MTDKLGFSFERQLIEDVIAAAERRATDDTQANRRDWIRAIFAAIEGLAWLAREHVREIGEETGELSPLAAMALREMSYSVDNKGRVQKQIRYIPLPAMIKLLIEQTRALRLGFHVDFSGEGWSHFNDALSIRHRITHPKSRADLHIADVDIATIDSGFSWFLATSLEILVAAQIAYADHVRDFGQLLDQLRNGDPAALAAYHAEFNRSE